MILLRTLGSCDLTAPNRPGAAAVLAQPKRFALLAYLAVAAPRGFVRRDTLLALFWPDADQGRGRQVLRQTIYLLRQSLGPGALPGRGDEELSVDPAALQCDVVRFEEELTSGRTAEALERYHGDFLTGLHVPDASQELEEWIERERRRLRSLATAGAWRLAEADERARNVAGAAIWARRAAELDPRDETGVRDLMRLLARVGDRSGALRAFDEYARRARKDLGVEPGADLRALAESLRGSPAAVNPGAPPGPPRPDVSDARPPAPGSGAASPTRRLRVWVLAAVGLVLLVAAVTRWPRSSPEPRTIAIGPITGAQAGDTSGASVTSSLLSTSLGRLTGLQVIPIARLYDIEAQLRAAGRGATSAVAAARQAGATELLRGAVHRATGGRIRLDLEVVDLGTGAAARTYRAEGADLFAAVDAATALVARDYGARPPREGITEVTTPSLVALRLYEQGLRELYQQGNLGSAYRLFRAGLAEDSTFALAAYYAYLTRGESNPDAAELAARAVRLAGRTADRERLLILSLYNQELDEPVALAQAETLVARFPAEPDGHYALGVARSRAGDFHGAVAELVRVVAMDSLGLHGDAARCRACDAYADMTAAYVNADSLPAAERVAREFARARPRSAGAHAALAAVLGYQDRYAEALAELRAAHRIAPASDVERSQAEAAIAIQAGNYVEADRQLAAFSRTRDEHQEQAQWLLSISLRNQGRLREALDLARRIRFRGMGADTVRALGNAVVLAQTLFEMGRFGESAALFDSVAARPPFESWQRGKAARHRAWHLTHAATALAAARDTARLAALADSIEAIGLASVYGRDRRLHHYVRALLLRVRGRNAEAEAAFRRAVYSWSTGYTRTNLELGRLLLARGRARDAIAVLQPALRGPLDASNLYVTRTELHELLARAFEADGARDSAVAHYRAVAAAWNRADPAFRTRLAQAKARAEAPRRPGA